MVIFLDSGAAYNKAHLISMDITHVLNAAQGKTGSTVDTNAEYYQDVGINFLGFPLLDSPNVNISHYLREAADFIDEALRAGGEWTYCT